MTEAGGDRPLPAHPSGWQVRNVGDIATVVRGVSYRKDQISSEPRDGHIPLLRSGNVQDELDLFRKLVHVPNELVRDDQRLAKDDIVVSVSNSRELVGKAAPLQQTWEGTFGAFLGVIRPVGGAVDPAYLALFFKSPAYRREIKKLSGATSNIANIRKGHLLDLSLALPPLEEQARIVRDVESLLANIAAAERQLDDSSADLARYESAAVRDALSGHPEMRIGDVCEVRSGYGFSKDLQGRAAGELPFAKVRDISEALTAGHVTLETANHFISRAEAERLRMRTFPAGTVAMAKIGEAVRLNRRIVLGTEALLDNNVMGWVPDTRKVRPAWLHLASLPLRLADISQATTVPSVRKSDVVEIKIGVPPVEQQDLLLAAVGVQRTAKRELAHGLGLARSQSARLRRSLLTAALQGDLGSQPARA